MFPSFPSEAILIIVSLELGSLGRDLNDHTCPTLYFDFTPSISSALLEFEVQLDINRKARDDRQRFIYQK
jgi:hypothetical protein